ncbi:hypothetical protein K492DRAFT_222453 [Lichtheimia hyalospora FSU 10163]|nr:hypothetical protein K492DRAFT_222453 [Lichtheimia hyalospora FSU 10163]
MNQVTMASDPSFSSTDLDPVYMQPRDDYEPPSDTTSDTIHIMTDEEEFLTERREILDNLSTDASASIGGSELVSSDEPFGSDGSSFIVDNNVSEGSPSVAVGSIAEGASTVASSEESIHMGAPHETLRTINDQIHANCHRGYPGLFWQCIVCHEVFITMPAVALHIYDVHPDILPEPWRY